MLSKTFGNLLLLIIAQISRAQDEVPALSEIDTVIPEDIRSPTGENVLSPYENRDALPVRSSPGPLGIASIFPRRKDELIETNAPLVTIPSKTQEHRLNGIMDDTLREFGAITEKISSPFRRLTGTSSTVDLSPFNFLKHFENYQKFIDGLVDDESCSSIFNSIDQSIHMTRQLFQCSQAFHQLRSSLTSILPGTLINCLSNVRLKDDEDIS